MVRSDNGPPFTSQEIKEYMNENGIEHRRITPLWPQANSEAESFMKPLTKAIRSAHAEGKTWRKHLYKFLLNYRTTPHSTTGFAPAELLFNRKVRNKLPQLPTGHTSQSDLGAKVKENDDRAKVKMETYADMKMRAKTSTIKIGDVVLVRQRKRNKLSTQFDPSPFRVVRMNGTMVTACRNGKYITRNVSHFKVVDSKFEGEESDDEEDDDDLESSPNSNLTSNASDANQNPRNNLRRSTRNRR